VPAGIGGPKIAMILGGFDAEVIWVESPAGGDLSLNSGEADRRSPTWKQIFPQQEDDYSFAEFTLTLGYNTSFG